MARKSKAATLSLAASILGKKGGSMRTEKQHAAHVENARKLNDCDVSERNRRAALAIPEDDRKSRARAAVAARWAKRDAETGPGMDQSEFRRLTTGMTAAAIADALGVTYSKVVSWRRRSNPVKIGEADAKRIRAWADAHAD